MSNQVNRKIYVQDYNSRKESKLYELDLQTGKATLVADVGAQIYDLAFSNTQLYALEKKRLRKTMSLVKVDVTTGKTEAIGNIGFDAVGLACNPINGKLYATAHRDRQLIEIDPTTGKGTVAVTLQDSEANVGEIAFDNNGIAYLSVLGNDVKKYLATCDLETGKINRIGEIGYPGLASMKFIGNTLYGVCGKYEGLEGEDGQLISIDTATGSGRLIFKTDPALCWAGIDIYESIGSITPLGGSINSPVATTRTSNSRSSDTSSELVSSSISVDGNNTNYNSSRGSKTNEEITFTFSFDDSQMEEAWKQIAAQVESAVTVTEEQDSALEARRWDQLEKWLLTGYQKQAKELAIKVARLDLMMNTMKRQLEGNLQLTFKRWSSHFDGRLESIVGTQIEEVTQANINVAIEQLKLDILDQTTQTIQTEIGYQFKPGK